MANLVGTSADDVITGTSDNDVIEGGAGNDRLSGGSGDDEIVGGAGADVIDGGDGRDFLYSAVRAYPFAYQFGGYNTGGLYSLPNVPPPLLDTGSEHDVIAGGNGSDFISAGYGDDVDGGTSSYFVPEGGYTVQDTDVLWLSLVGAPAGVTVDFRNPTLTIGGGTITNIEAIPLVQGTNFDDVLYGGRLVGSLYGMGGNDLLVGGAGIGLIDGGDGNDIIDVTQFPQPSNLNYYPTLIGGAGNDTFLTPETGYFYFAIDGGDGDDSITAMGNIHGGSGNDRIELRGSSSVYGDAGDDYIAFLPDRDNYGGLTAFGGDGADTIIGGRDGDILGTAGVGQGQGYNILPGDDLALDHDVISAGGAEDLVGGGYGDDLDGGAGFDRLRLSFAGLQTGITFDAGTIAGGAAATVGGGVIQNFEALVYLRGTDFNDTLTLAAQIRTDDSSGYTRDELIEVHAGAGDDLIVGANSFANVFGEAGDDRFVSGSSPDIFDGGAGTDTVDYSVYATSVGVALASGSGADGDRLISVENVVGSSHDDVIVGSDGANVLSGGAGNDVLTGGLGADTLVGGTGRDVFSDTAAGHNGDTIADFQAGDSIVFSDGSLASFIYTMQGNVLSFAGGSLTLSGVSQPNFVATAVAGGGVRLSLAASPPPAQIFQAPGSPLLANFNPANGWTSQTATPRHLADVNGDGRADIVGFGDAGVLVSYSAAGGTYGQPGLVFADFGKASGWTDDNLFHRIVADVNGDGRADIIGFGYAGTLISLARFDGSFGPIQYGLEDLGQDQGWTSQNGFARLAGDVNGDGKADLIGFGYAGTLVALGHGDGTFEGVDTGLANFGVDQGWTNQDRFTRALADVNGDGKADLIGFGDAGTYVALSNGDGTFAQARLVLNEFGTSQGWTSDTSLKRIVADVNGDGIADIVGFGQSGVVVALGLGDGTFAHSRADVAAFGLAQGWTSDNSTPRELADINGDGYLDIVGIGSTGVVASLNAYGHA